MSLRLRVLLTILVVYLVASVVLAGVFLSETSQVRMLQDEVFRERYFSWVIDKLCDHIKEEWRDSSDLDGFRRQVGKILGWKIWREHFRDVIITDVEAGPLGGEILVPARICFSPLGSFRRSHPFGWEKIRAGLKRSIRTKDRVEVGQGRCEFIPVYRGSLPVGAIYYEPLLPQELPVADPTKPLLILGSFTLVLMLALYLALSRYVVVPLESFSDQVRKLAGNGQRDLISLPKGVREVRSLALTFNETISRIHTFQDELAAEVERVTREVQAKERQLVLSSRLAAMGTLAAGIAHEINNPLGGLINAARRIKKLAPREAGLDEYLEMLEEGLDRIASVVRRVLEFSPRNLQPTTFPLIEPARRAIAFIAHRADRMGVELHATGPEEAQVRGDAGEIQQVFLNLLMNGLDALPDR